MRGDQLVRQWKILRLMCGSSWGFSVIELADILSEKKRNIYRDIEILKKVGFKIHIRKEGRYSYYYCDNQEIPCR